MVRWIAAGGPVASYACIIWTPGGLGAARLFAVQHRVSDFVRGFVVGTVLALAFGRLAASMLYGLRPSDPFTLAAGVLVMAAIAGVASGLPALRAARVNPMSALREE